MSPKRVPFFYGWFLVAIAWVCYGFGISPAYYSWGNFAGSIIEDLGLSDAIASECQNFSEREGIHIDFVPGGVLDGLPREISLCLSRVVQEGLRNVARHSRAKEARVSARRENGTLRLSIRDSGVGFDPARPKGRAGSPNVQDLTRRPNGLASPTSRGRRQPCAAPR